MLLLLLQCAGMDGAAYGRSTGSPARHESVEPIGRTKSLRCGVVSFVHIHMDVQGWPRGSHIRALL